MKRYLFIFIAMFTVAFTTISLTSCQKDEDKSSDGDYFYSGTATPTLYDPQGELNDKQKAELQELIIKTPVFNVMYSTDADNVDKKYNDWLTAFVEKLLEYMDNNPEVADTQYAGVIVLVKRNGFGSQEEKRPYIFSEMARKILEGNKDK